MKVLLAALVLGFAATLAFPSSETTDEIESEWTMIPDENGDFHFINMKEVEFEAALASRAKTESKFLLFTKSNPTSGHHVILNNAESVHTSHFNAKHPTRFLIHGWNGDANAEINTLVRSAYLSRGDYNIFVVDWSSGAKTINYIAARNSVNTAGEQVAAFIDFMHEKHELNFNSLYVIGHSLGAHVSGMAGKHVKQGRVNTIYGLDAALPLFSINKANDRLATGDAVYVETIHTNGGKLGFENPIGDSSFYPNWGRKQPGCGIDLTGSCSHGRSVQYFAESLRGKNEFLGLDCGSYTDVLDKRCVSRGASAHMGGDPANHAVRGLYYVPTHDKMPFATGRV